MTLDEPEMKDCHKNRRLLYNLGINDYEMAERLGSSPSSMFQWRKSLGLKAHRTRSPCEQTNKYFAVRMDLYNLKLTDKQIAAEQGTNPDTIKQWRLSRGLLPNRKGTKDVQR